MAGGLSRLLHLGDWGEREKFTTHPLASQEWLFRGSASKNATEAAYHRFFQHEGGKLTIRFSDQFIHPRHGAEALYLNDLSDSLEAEPHVHERRLEIGDFLLLNNHVWLHGRSPFEPRADLCRGLHRQRGPFAT